MTGTPVQREVTDHSASAFDATLRQAAGMPRGVERVSFLTDCLTALAAAETLTRRERDRRAQLLVSAMSPAGEEVRELIGRIPSTAGSILNAVRAGLPPELRAIATPRAGTGLLPETSKPNKTARPDDAVIELNVVAASRPSMVLLVGTAEEHANNAALLQSHSLNPIRVHRVEEFVSVAKDGVCGAAIAPSAWVGLDASAQRQALTKVCEVSTFIFLRVSTDRLDPEVASSLHEIALNARCGSVDARMFCNAPTCDVTPADVAVIRRAATLLASAESSVFLPLEATEAQASLLRLLASERRSDEGQAAVRIRELAGGRSGAKLFLLEPPGVPPFVVKLGEIGLLCDELRRYQRWIAGWETQVTSPSLNLHMGAAALAYRLQNSAEAPGRPAPTLEQAVEGLVASEWFTDRDEATAKAFELENSLRAAAGRLADLNRRPAKGKGDEFWLHWAADGMGKRGLETVVPVCGGGSLTLTELCGLASKRLGPLSHRAIVHGDIHARNVLLVDGAPAFIDYSYSGPGNPLVDLVRLDACVRTIAMRASMCEDDLVDVFTAIYVEGADAEEVLKRAPCPLSASSRLAIKCACIVRARALQVAHAHGVGLAAGVSTTEREGPPSRARARRRTTGAVVDGRRGRLLPADGSVDGLDG